MSSGNLTNDITSLQPLDWAVDIYQDQDQDQDQINYEQLNTYLDNIISCLTLIKNDISKAKDQNLDQPIEFFHELGQMLTSKINQNNSDEKQLVNY